MLNYSFNRGILEQYPKSCASKLQWSVDTVVKMWRSSGPNRSRFMVPTGFYEFNWQADNISWHVKGLKVGCWAWGPEEALCQTLMCIFTNWCVLSNDHRANLGLRWYCSIEKPYTGTQQLIVSVGPLVVCHTAQGSLEEDFCFYQ